MKFSAVLLPLSLLAFLLIPPSARAIHHESGELVEECEWSPVVHLSFPGTACTGVYVGNKTILTAAHCLNTGLPSSVSFGDADKNAPYKYSSVDIDGCHVRDGWIKQGSIGPDIGVCTLTMDSATPPDVAIVLPMVPTGCARDQLAYEVYKTHACPNSEGKGCHDGPDVSTAGMGCEIVSCNTSGHKRSFVGKLVEQTKHLGTGNGTTTKLIFNQQENSQGPVPGLGGLSGDSGGPLLYRFPDGTWRVIGVRHGSYSYLGRYEAIPPYLHWIEDIGGDLTPCHDFVQGEWVWTGSCTNQFPINVDTSYSTWANECSGTSYGGGYNECGVTDLNLAPPKLSGQTPSGMLAPLDLLDDAYPGVLQLAIDGYFGRPADASAIAELFIDVGYGAGLLGFLDTEMPTGYVELYPTAAVYARRVIEDFQ